mmetsp:Transcript_27663/g.46443  ORF Transcript_27663/g.46443 Transcript_27663/m.46443 type:complete len:325 (+) Transcript_27663:133-1107(+)
MEFQLGFKVFTICAILSIKTVKGLVPGIGIPAVSNLIAILPSRDQLRPPVSIPQAIQRYYPLPQEELLTAFSRGNSYTVSGEFDKALREFNRAVDVAPNSPDVLLARGIVYEKLLKWDSAIDDYRTANKLIKSRPFGKDDATAISNIANAETGLLQWEDALRDFAYASKLRPNDFEAPRIGRALVLYQLDRKPESMTYFQELSEKYPEFPDAQAALAVMLYTTSVEDATAPSGASGIDTSTSAAGGGGGGGGVNTADERFGEAKSHWEAALKVDARYNDVSWVEDIRRWPPKLVADLKRFKSHIQQEAVLSKSRTDTAIQLLNL